MRIQVLSGVFQRISGIAGLKAAAAVCLLAGAASAGASTYTVTNTLDDGSTGSLRWAVSQVNGDGSADTIDLTGVSGTITLTSALPAITNSVTFSGPGASALTISGGGSFSVFIADATAVSISGLTIANGTGYHTSGSIYGGGLAVIAGTVAVNECVFMGNSATTGGAIFNQGALTVSNTSFSGNSASSAGGGIASNTAMTISGSTFSSRRLRRSLRRLRTAHSPAQA
jgi:predicted outer membrane repeat protein